MIRHFFLDKTNTIISGTRANTGLNPILKLNYGKDISRGLIHFDERQIQNLIDDKEINIENTKFILKMTNCFSTDGVPYEKILTSNGLSFGQRACSFSLMLFRLPQDFDEGRGFDYDSDFWLRGNSSYSENGSNWYFAKNGTVWERDLKKKIYFKLENNGDDLNPDFHYKPIDYGIIDAVEVDEVPADKDITEFDPSYIYIEKEVDFTKGDINWDTVIRDKNIKGGIYAQDFLENEYRKYNTYYKLASVKEYYKLKVDGWESAYIKSDEPIDNAHFIGDYIYGQIQNIPMGIKATLTNKVPNNPDINSDEYIKVEKGGCPTKYEFYQLMTNDEYMMTPPMNAFDSLYTIRYEYQEIDLPTDGEKCKAVDIKTIHTELNENSDPIVRESSIIIGIQHFDHGMENLAIDITEYVESIINKDYRNYGLGLSFIPSLERTVMPLSQYVGFYTDHTNTFFHPYVEMISNNIIDDDRNTFCIGQTNKLYLYAKIDGEPVNLDKIPTCEINGIKVKTGQSKKGAYFAVVEPNEVEMEQQSIGYDYWSEMSLNGARIDDVEMEFEVMPLNKKIQVGSLTDDSKNIVPFISGINDDEKLRRGEVRTVNVDFRKRYSTDEKHIIFHSEYRIYAKDGKENREYEVFGYTLIERGFLNNFFVIYTEDLIPNKYHIDVRVHDGRNVKYYKDIAQFEIISDVTNRYE